jgi:hypothetical protein
MVAKTLSSAPRPNTHWSQTYTLNPEAFRLGKLDYDGFNLTPRLRPFKLGTPSLIRKQSSEHFTPKSQHHHLSPRLNNSNPVGSLVDLDGSNLVTVSLDQLGHLLA